MTEHRSTFTTPEGAVWCSSEPHVMANADGTWSVDMGAVCVDLDANGLACHWHHKVSVDLRLPSQEAAFALKLAMLGGVGAPS